MKSYLINLSRSPERLERMSALFVDMGVEFTRISAIDGRELTQQEIDGWLSGDGNFYRLGPGEVGCFLSHRRCWELVAEGEDSHAAIFEDDLHFGEGLKDVLALTDWIPCDADIVKLETTLTRTLYQRTPAAMIAGRTIRRLCGPQFGGGGYIVSRRCARQLVKLSTKIADPVDQFMFNTNLYPASSFQIYQMIPAICIQDWFVDKENSKNTKLKSTLFDERPVTAKPLKSKILREVARPFERGGLKLKALFGRMVWDKIPMK